MAQPRIPATAEVHLPPNDQGRELPEKREASRPSRPLAQQEVQSAPPILTPPTPSSVPEDGGVHLEVVTETASLQRWNESNVSVFRFFTTLYSFIIMGMNDSAVGALIPYIEPYYHVTYTVLSLVFLSPFVGYLFAALSNNLVHHHFGQVGVAVIGPTCRLIGYIPMACHPPFPALPVVMLFPGFGNGIEDSAWNAWIGNMQNANELLGFLHGAYGLGATISPLIATTMVIKGGLPWYAFYYLMIGMSSLEAVLSITAFWGASGRVHRELHTSTTGQKRTTTRRVLCEPITWLMAIFLLGYVGAEVSLGGWIVSFMLDVRHAGNFAAGMAVTGFWLGLTLGRVILGFITGRIGEKLAIIIYLVLAICLELLYWLVPSFVSSAVVVGILGFFLGPLFPAAIVAATKLLPNDFHVSAIGFAAAFGGGGAAIFPFAVGAIAQSRGVQVLQPMVISILAFILATWICLPGGFGRGGLEKAREKQEKAGHGVRVAVRGLLMRARRGYKKAAKPPLSEDPSAATAVEP